MSVAVSGTTAESQEHEAAWAGFPMAKVVVDADFVHMLDYNQGAQTGTASSDFSLFNEIEFLEGLPEQSKLQPHLEAMGLHVRGGS